MAGIGFSLQQLVQDDRLSSKLRGFLHATAIVAGPWLITCVILALLQSLAQGLVKDAAMIRFSSLTLYAFSISLVVSGPIAMVVSRCLADAIYAKQVRGVPAMLFKSLNVVLAVLALIGLPLFGWLLDLPLADRVLGFALMMVCGGVWVVMGLMSALRSYRTVTWAFGAGLVVAYLIGSFSVGSLRSTGLLLALTVGLAVVLFTLVARLLAEFPGAHDAADLHFNLWGATRRHQHLAWAGLWYSAALWVDKWIMWYAPGALGFDRGVRTNSLYESGMFFALLTIVPVLAVVLIDVETRFHATYQRYYRDIAARGTLRTVRRNHGAIVRNTSTSFSRLAVVQGVLALVAVLAAPALVAWVGGGLEMTSIFRFGVMGAAFHVLLMVCLSALAYFDRTRWMAAVAALFFALNAGLTAVGVGLGEAYHGWGYAVAALLSFAVAFYVASNTIARLPYMTFVASNPSVRSPQPPRTAKPRRRPRAASVLAQGI